VFDERLVKFSLDVTGIRKSSQVLCSGSQRPTAGNHQNGVFVKVPCNLTESQEMNLSASITRD
jgi:hypothetical protein